MGDTSERNRAVVPWAGRRPTPGFRHEGETASDHLTRVHQFATTNQAGIPDADSLPAGSETAQEQFKRFLREQLAPLLREMGLKGSGTEFRIDHGPFRGRLGIQKSRWNTKAYVEFTINVGAQYIPTKRGYWGERIGALLPDMVDTWWGMCAGASTDLLCSELDSAIQDYILVALRAATDEPEFPPDPKRTWSRTFVDPITLGPGPPVNPFAFLDPTARQPPLNVDGALAELSDSDFGRRCAALLLLYVWAPTDQRLLGACISMLESEPRSYTRMTAAKMLGFLPVRTPEVAPALQAAAQNDEELEVRIAARYALGLIDQPPPAAR